MTGRVVLGVPGGAWHLLPFDLRRGDVARCGAALPVGWERRNEEEVPARRVCARCRRRTPGGAAS